MSSNALYETESANVNSRTFNLFNFQGFSKGLTLTDYYSADFLENDHNTLLS